MVSAAMGAGINTVESPKMYPIQLAAFTQNRQPPIATLEDDMEHVIWAAALAVTMAGAFIWVWNMRLKLESVRAAMAKLLDKIDPNAPTQEELLFWKNEAAKFATKRGELLKHANGMLEILEIVQWEKGVDFRGRCQVCRAFGNMGHRSDCKVKRKMDAYKDYVEGSDA